MSVSYVWCMNVACRGTTILTPIWTYWDTWVCHIYDAWMLPAEAVQYSPDNWDTWVCHIYDARVCLQRPYNTHPIIINNKWWMMIKYWDAWVCHICDAWVCLQRPYNTHPIIDIHECAIYMMHECCLQRHDNTHPDMNLLRSYHILYMWCRSVPAEAVQYSPDNN